MKKTLTALGAAVALSATAAAGEFYELRTYQIKGSDKAASFDRMMAAAIPILERAGVSPVGVFKARDPKKDGDPNWRYVLATADSLDTLAKSRGAFETESEFLETAREYLTFGKEDPPFDRISITSFQAFDGFPKLVKPDAESAGGRFFELREYQSHNELKAYLKVKMFNDGELDIFADVGLKAVFFGSALTGPDLPNLTYMLAYDSDEAKTKAWDGFKASPAWKVLRSEEMYQDTVSKIISKFVVALPYSSIK